MEEITKAKMAEMIKRCQRIENPLERFLEESNLYFMWDQQSSKKEGCRDGEK